jgi:hypothetical protein
MSTPRVLFQMVRADFRERTRRYSFLVTLASALYLAYAVAAEKVWIVVGNGYRGVYNSAWIGALMAICCSTFLSLAGFYIVKNSVQRDVDTRVGQILAATPMRKDFYTLAKMLSNFAVLACMVFVLMLAAVAMQRMLAAPGSFSLWKLWAPFLLLALPTMLITGSIAVLFETLPVLRGGVGNVIYFFLWTTSLALGINGVDDPSGLRLMYSGTREALRAIDPEVQEHFAFSLTIGGARAVRTFLWNGIEWTSRVLLWRLIWIAAAVAIAMLASIFFHRFDPARSLFKRRVGLAAALRPEGVDAGPTMSTAAIHLTPLGASRATNRFGQLVLSELRLMLKGQRWWWYAIAAGLLVGELVSPDPMTRGGFLIAAWIWPILVWSQMGCRESRHNTGALLFSCERSLTRQLPAVLGAGVLVSLLTGAGVGIRLSLAADWHSLAAWMAGAAFIPSMALALGIWTGNSKMFEALYTVWWYVGPAHQIPGLDFMGITPASSTPGLYAVAALFLVMTAYWRRRQRLGYA